MRTAIAAAGLMLAATALPARAQDIDMNTIKCKDFIAADKSEVGNILIWLEGFYTKEDDPPILHVQKMQSDAQNLGKFCGNNPNVSIITAAEKVMPVK